MREILFRGKTAEGDWTYGYYVHTPKRTGAFGQTVSQADVDRHHILTMKCNIIKEIYPETIGQYTGLTDKNGNKIFEGDIVVDVACSPMYQSPRVVRFGTGTFDSGVYKYTGFVAMLPNGDTELGEMTSAYVDEYNCPNGWEVIGNIHDNPEVLKGEQ